MPKEIKKLKGTARIYDDESMDFTPQKEGTPVQKDVKRVRKSTFYATNGEKDSSYVLHLNVDKNATDPVAELTEDFDKLVKNIDKKAEKRLKGKTLMDANGTSVTLNKKQHVLQVAVNIDLERNSLYKDYLYKQVFEIIRCFISNQTLIASAIPAPQKNLTE